MHEGFGPAELPRLRADFAGHARRRIAVADGGAGLAGILAINRSRPGPRPAASDALARSLVAGEFEEARERLAARLAGGVARLSLLLREIVPAARQLGDFWADDACDFFEVTRAAGCLAELLREIAPDDDIAQAADAPAILVTLAPGETHALGAEIVERVFRQAGWRAVRCAAEDAGAALADDRFDVVGFSLACARYAAALPAAIAEARAASCNDRLTVILGGAAFAADAGLAAGLDAQFCLCERDIATHFPLSLLSALRL